MLRLWLPKNGSEISDEIVAFDPETLKRLPVRKQQVIQDFLSRGNRTAARIVNDIPERNGELEEGAVDRLLINAHCEIQRISEEFQHGQRVLELLKPLVHVLREKGMKSSIRVVDIGCGTGFVVRWLAAHLSALGTDVELIGADYNAALVEEAGQLARAENLTCSFVVANAFRLKSPATIYLSTGILHHFQGAGLVRLFEQHDRQETQAFLHFDFQPALFAPFGSWLFHAARMREPLSRHDGVLSAMRVHSGQALLTAARRGAPRFRSSIYGARLWRLPLPRVFHTVMGILPEDEEALVNALGKRATRLGEFG
ncbi:MAG TPA: methyltransferase domain-containing protein [Pyrinomonadaceae bacterium]|jgi:SAM-dependent methyltransferase